jgi:hypothetical protein
VQDVPALRIIDDTLWRRTKLRQKEIPRDFRQAETGTNRLNHTHRRQFLLSGLFVCGICEGPYTIRGEDRYACANHVNRGICANGRTISRKAIETRVLDGLKHKLLAPELLEAFIDEFIVTWNEGNREAEENWASSRRELAEINRRIAAIIEAVESGMRTNSMRDRLLALEARKANLEQMAKPDSMARMHPKLAEVYRQHVERLEEALNDSTIRPEATDALRTLIDRRGGTCARAEANSAAWTPSLTGWIALALDQASGSVTHAMSTWTPLLLAANRISAVIAAALDEKPNAESKRIFATVHELLGSSVEMPPLGAHARDRVMP